VTSSDNRTQSICVLFSPPVYYRNSPLTSDKQHFTNDRKKRKSLKSYIGDDDIFWLIRWLFFRKLWK